MTGNPAQGGIPAPEAPAATIRRAAARMRDAHGPGHLQHGFWAMLARELDRIALDANAARLTGSILITTWCDEPGAVISALSVARAYLADTT